MDWAFNTNTILLLVILVLLIHIIRTAVTAHDILIYFGLSNDEIIDVLKADKKELHTKLSGLKIEISDQVRKDEKLEKKRNERNNKTR